MNASSLRVAALLLALPFPANAGGPAPKAPPPAPIAPVSDAWEATLSVPGWMAGLDGTVGARGFTAETSVPFKDILSNLDMAAMLNLEARKGRWGGWVDGIYLKMSMDGDTPGPLLDRIGVSVEQVIAEAALFYRIWESDKGFLDLYGGARYMAMSGDLSLDVSDAGARDVSEQLSAQVVDQVVAAVRHQTSAALSAAKTKIAAQAAGRAQTALATVVSAKAQAARDAISNLRSIAAAHPRLTEVIKNSKRLQNAIRTAAEARVDERVAELQGQAANAQNAAQAAAAAAQQAVASAKARAKSAVRRAEKELAKEIERALQDAIPSEISQSIDWIDPFVGMRARCNFNERFYGIAKADVGGFGISSDLVWQVYAALGYLLNERTSVELGYKHLAVDYTRHGFTFDADMSGLMLGMSIRL